MKKLIVFTFVIAILFADGVKEGRVAIGDDTLTVEIAVTPYEREMGLMFRSFLPEGHGMLFIFDSEEYLSFWMKNTSIPLSIAFINSDGIIVDIQDMEPFSTRPHVSRERAIFALEVNKGWFRRHGVKVGDRVKFLLD